MKNLYKLLKLTFLTAMPVLFLLLMSTNVYAQQPLTETVEITFPSLGGTDSGEDNEAVNLVDATCGVANITFEIIEDNTDFGTYIDRIRTADGGDAIFYAGASYELNVPFTVENVQSYGTADWQVWLHEESSSAPQTATVRITYEYHLPNAVCQDFTLNLDGTGSATLDVADIDNGSIGCEPIVLSLSKTSFNGTDVGENTVTLTVEDNAGLTASCDATVTVVGESDCRDTTLQLDASGAAALTAADLYIGTDAGVSPVSLSQTDFVCTDVGDVSVTLTLEDEGGNQTTCTSTVTVADTLKPMVMCQDTTVRLDETGNFALTTEHVDDGSSDNCGIASMSVSPDAFTAANLGDNTVTLTVEDNNGNVNTCESIVTIKKDTDAECKDTTLYLDDTGAATLAAADVLVSTNVENYTLTLEKTDFSCADLGSYKNKLSVSDEKEVSAICYSMVTVMDTTPPVVTCNDLELSLDATGAASIVEGDIVTSSTDNCGIQETLLSQTDFNCKSTRENLVTITVTDVSGNETMCYSTVTVTDDMAPTALCKDITVQLDENDVFSLAPSDIDNGSTDNCEFTMLVDMPELDCSNVGANTVTLTVTDNAGNSSTCESTVTVEDVLAPTLVCEETTVYLRDNGVYVLGRDEIRAIAIGADNTNSCASSQFLDVAISQRLFDCEDAGKSIPVTITATDAQGQTSTCETHIKVRDNISPVVTCVDTTIDLYLDETGSASIDAASIMMNDEADACESTMSLSQSVFSCEDAGENTVTLTVSDPSNNSASCDAMVMVYDTVAPVVDTIENIEIELEAGVCESMIDYPVPQVMDNCGVEFELVEGLGEEGMFPAGTTTETWTATDAGGNSVTFSFDVTLIAQNDTPMINDVDDVIVFEGTSPVNVELSGISSGDDCVDQDVMISAEAANMDLVTDITVNYTQGNATGSLDLTIAPEMTGQSEITVTVEDPDGAMVTETFMLTVNAAENNPPVLVSPIADQVVNASYMLEIPVSSTLGEYFDDPDGDELTFNVMLENGDPLPAWATYANDTIVAEPMIADTGCVMVIVEAMDADGEAATDTFELCVEGYPVNIDDIEAGQFEINLYPNPTRGMVNVDFTTNAIYDVDLAVVDITGRQILRKQFSATDQISFDLKENVSGMYFIKLNFGGNQVLKKVILDKQ